jgi:hypothetical protein
VFLADDPRVAGFPLGPPAPGSDTFTVRFQTDDFPAESQWNIQDLNGKVIWYAFMNEWAPGADVKYPIHLVKHEKYLFVVYDSIGDGLCK